jgi:hypothetical protein
MVSKQFALTVAHTDHNSHLLLILVELQVNLIFAFQKSFVRLLNLIYCGRSAYL